MQQISDYLFMGSLIFLVITFMIFFLGSGGMTSYRNVSNDTGALTDLQMNHDHKKMLEKQNNGLVRLLKSYLFWIPVTGIIVSIVLSKI
ncbi:MULTISPECIES: hypothetical protein [Paenibacillus]|uniref:DUF3899 domain-containing protein n=1 Tax=Paenibacillus violae TaxID=3077234 RepID=A0ABU3RKY2_9BACL|nr:MULTISPECIES: hypothetical protein [Paenibacillus]MDU0204751.1 hypothetical protein [Paenibacillus sp. PFR10]MEC0270557.1 hypothetical protein [Paenibacillus anseongense]